MPSDTWIRTALTSRSVVPYGRAIGLARILCQADVLAYMKALQVDARRLFESIETVMTGEAADASCLAWALDMTEVQKLYVWASFVDAYAIAVEWVYTTIDWERTESFLRAARRLATAFGLSLSFRNLYDIAAMAKRVNGTPSASVPPGGWNKLVRVLRSRWFRDDSAILQPELLRRVEASLPPSLIAALRR